MDGLRNNRKAPLLTASLFVIAAALLVGLITPCAKGEESPELTSVSILVKDAKTDQPMQNAHLTLQFREAGDPSKLKRSKVISYSAKTNLQGRYKFTHIPKGTIRLLVTAERRQAFGEEFEIDKDDQVIEVKGRARRCRSRARRLAGSACRWC